MARISWDQGAETGQDREELFRGDLFDHREQVIEQAVPGFDFAEARALEFGIGRVVFDRGAQSIEMVVGVVEMRLDAEAEEAGGQSAEVEFGLEMLLAHTRQEDALDGAELPEPLEALEGAAAAGPEQGHDFVEVERARSGEEEPIDLADGARQGERAGGADEERNGLLLEGSQGRCQGACPRHSGTAGFFRSAGRLPPLVKT